MIGLTANRAQASNFDGAVMPASSAGRRAVSRRLWRHGGVPGHPEKWREKPFYACGGVIVRDRLPRATSSLLAAIVPRASMAYAWRASSAGRLMTAGDRRRPARSSSENIIRRVAHS